MEKLKLIYDKIYYAIGATIIGAMVLCMSPEEWLVFDLKILLAILIIAVIVDYTTVNRKSIFNLIMRIIRNHQREVQSLKTDYKQIKTSVVLADRKSTEVKEKMDYLLQTSPNQHLGRKKDILEISNYSNFFDELVDRTIIRYLMIHIDKFSLLDIIKGTNKFTEPEETIEKILDIVEKISTSLIKKDQIPTNLPIIPLDEFLTKAETKALIYNISKMVHDICKQIKVNIDFADIKKIFGNYLSTISAIEITKRKPDPLIYTRYNLEDYNDNTHQRLIHIIADIVESNQSVPKAFKLATETLRMKQQTKQVH